MNKFIEYFRDVSKLLIFTLISYIIVLEAGIPTRSTFDIPVVKFAYVQNIDTPQLGTKKVKKVLDKFNELGYSKVVSYDRKFIPIWIYEANLPKSTLGVAFSTILGCQIILDTKKLQHSEEILKHVIIHEYLHCLGYPHTYNPVRVMYSKHSGTGQNDYEAYAKELLERLK